MSAEQAAGPVGKGDPSCAPPKPEVDPGIEDKPPSVCKQVLLDDGKSCIPDGDIKKLALETCERGGLTANAIDGQPCRGGLTAVVVACCPHQGVPPVAKPYPGEKPVPPPAKGDPYPTKPQPTLCDWHVFGEGMKCYSYDDIKLQTHRACSDVGLTLTELHPANDCEGGSTAAKYACCGSKLPEPPKPQPYCSFRAFGDGTKCYSHADIKDQTLRACSELGLTLTEVHPANDCDGGSTIAKFACCAAK